MKRISLDIDAPDNEFFSFRQFGKYWNLCTGVYSKSEDPESISRFGMDVGEQKELFFYRREEENTFKIGFQFYRRRLLPQQDF